MMIKKHLGGLLFFALTCFSFATASAQQSVSGKIADSITNEALPFATVRLLNQAQQVIKSTLTDSSGHFVFMRVTPSTYSLYFSITGYNAKHSANFFLKDTTVVLPTYLLSRANNALATVTITARRPLITSKIDGFIYNAGQDIQSAGESATDLLRKVPGVQVDQNGSPQMRGSNKIQVFIDGRPSVTYASSVSEALSRISADNIKTIEVITHPSAKYDADGVDGVIKIQTKRPVNDGLTGTATATLGTRFNEQTSAFTWKQRKVILTMDFARDYATNLTTSTLVRNDLVSNTGLRQNKEVSGDSKGLYAGANFIYVPDTLTTVNAGYRYGGNRFGAETTLASFADADAFSRTINNPSNRFLNAVNAGWLHTSPDKLTEINLMAYYFYQGQNGNYLLDQYRSSQRDYSEKNFNHIDNSEFSFQADVSKKLKSGNGLEFGAKGAFRYFSYDNRFDVLDPNQLAYLPDSKRADRFWFNGATIATYISYTLKLNTWQIKSGLRYEQVHRPLHFENIELRMPDFQNLLPNLIVYKKISGSQQISIGYARKLLGPYINYQNPVVNYIDSLNLEYGNPHLKPAVTNSYDLSYTFQKSGWLLNLALFYNQTGNSIERVRIEQPGGVVANTYDNIGDNKIWGGSLSASLRLKQLIFSMTNTSRYLTFKDPNSNLYSNGFMMNQSMDVTYKPGKSWSLRTYANLSSRNISVQGYTNGVASYTISVGKSFFADALNFSARCENLFAPYRDVSEITKAATFDQQLETRYINRSFRVSVRWRWGKKTVSRPQVREIGGY
jgi:outer membrane receptor protein involved in Fe transport